MQEHTPYVLAPSCQAIGDLGRESYSSWGPVTGAMAGPEQSPRPNSQLSITGDQMSQKLRARTDERRRVGREFSYIGCEFKMTLVNPATPTALSRLEAYQMVRIPPRLSCQRRRWWFVVKPDRSCMGLHLASPLDRYIGQMAGTY